MSEFCSGVVLRLWERRRIRRLMFVVGLVLQLALVGFMLGWTLTPSGDVIKARPHAMATHVPATSDVN